MLKRIAKEKRSLAKRLLERIEDFFHILKMSKEERKAFVKLEQARACLEKALLAAGETREDGKILQRSAIKLNDYEVFGIKSLNDYVGVQKAVLKKLLEEGFFSDGRNIIVNNDSGMEIEITKDGIKETLGKGKRFEELPRKLKELKISTIRTLPHLIETVQLVKDNSPNVHKNTSDLKYAYLSNEITVQTDNGNEDYIVTIAVRKSRQKNKFWIHEIRTTKSEQRLSSSGDVNPEQEYNKTVAHEQIVSQKSYSVKPDAKKSKADAEFEKQTAGDQVFKETSEKGVPVITTRQRMSEGQIKKMVADGTRDKVYSRKDAGGILNRLIAEYAPGDVDFGALQGKSFGEVVQEFWKKLNTVDKEKRRGMAERFADYVLKCSTMNEVFENSENVKLSAAVGFLDSYLTRVDLQDIRNELQKRYGEDTSVFIRWGKRRHTKDVVMI